MANSSGSAPAQRLTLITLIVVALVAVGVIVYFQVAPQQGSAPTASGGDIDVSGQPMLGQEDAPAELVVFEDFKCPACRNFDAEVMPQIERELVDTGQAKIHFVNFPFIGPDSTTAAIAGECVYEQDPAAFWDYKTYVFRSQGPESEQWATPTFLASIARDNVPSVDADALQSCIEDETHADQVEADRTLGNTAGVNATPTVFVNGEALESSDFASVQNAVSSAQEQ